MGEWILSGMSEAIFPYLVFWIPGLLFFAIEIIRPARPLHYRGVIPRDLIALGTYNIFFSWL